MSYGLNSSSAIMFVDSYEIWKKERIAAKIITLCKEFDDAIDGGLRVSKITELVGGPGSGKTQFW